MSTSIVLPTITLTYGTIELVIAESTLLCNTAPFTATNPSVDLNTVGRRCPAQCFQVAVHPPRGPSEINPCRAYATLIMFHRITQNPQLHATFQQAKDELMGANAEDTLLFIVAKLLRYNDSELRLYLQRPHILQSSLLECKQEFILGEGNVLALFQEARKQCTADASDRLSMKQFRLLYQRLDPQSPLPAPSTSVNPMLPEGKEEKAESKDDAVASGSTSPRRTRTTISSSSSLSPSSSSSSSSSASSSSSLSVLSSDSICTKVSLHSIPSEAQSSVGMFCLQMRRSS